MASTLSTRLKDKLLTAIQADLETGSGIAKLVLYDASDKVLSESVFLNNNVVQTIDSGYIYCELPQPAQALEDSTVGYGILYNANGETAYENIPVGTPTQNPNSPIQLNSLIFYKGGVFTILNFRIG